MGGRWRCDWFECPGGVNEGVLHKMFLFEGMYMFDFVVMASLRTEPLLTCTLWWIYPFPPPPPHINMEIKGSEGSAEFLQNQCEIFFEIR